MVYITDTKQLTDFFWYRDSGIRVNVGLQNIDVIPTYEDVDHEGDGDFMMQNPSGKAELEYFRSIQLNRCRLAIPSININSSNWHKHSMICDVAIKELS